MFVTIDKVLYCYFYVYGNTKYSVVSLICEIMFNDKYLGHRALLFSFLLQIILVLSFVLVH